MSQVSSLCLQELNGSQPCTNKKCEKMDRFKNFPEDPEASAHVSAKLGGRISALNSGLTSFALERTY